MMVTLAQPGDFTCVPVRGEGGTLIRIGELLNGDKFTAYQHAELFVGRTLPAATVRQSTEPGMVSTQFGWMLGAYPGGARLTELKSAPEALDGALWSTGAFELTAAQRDLIVATALSKIGTPYSWLDYWALAGHRFHLDTAALQRYIAADAHMICSQLVDWVYMTAGIQLFSDERWPGYVTPADLASLIEAKLVK